MARQYSNRASQTKEEFTVIETTTTTTGAKDDLSTLKAAEEKRTFHPGR
jgi:hypothetical protein